VNRDWVSPGYGAGVSFDLAITTKHSPKPICRFRIAMIYFCGENLDMPFATTSRKCRPVVELAQQPRRAACSSRRSTYAAWKSQSSGIAAARDIRVCVIAQTPFVHEPMLRSVQ
jgi:hypothetical protein